MSCNFISVSDAKFLIKYIFAFHIIKNNFYFFLSTDSNPLFTSIPSRYLLHLNWDGDGSQPPTEPSGFQYIPAPTVKPKPAAAAIIHQFLHVTDPLIPISNPPDSIPHQGVSPP